MMFLLVIGLVVLVYFVWKNNTGGSRDFFQGHSASNIPTSELEEELKRRKSAVSLESEVADLKKQIEALKQAKNNE